jgi:hypothetical protein
MFAIGHLQCPKESSEYLLWYCGARDNTKWVSITRITSFVGKGPPQGSRVQCKVCRESPICRGVCHARITYIHLAPLHVSHACIHDPSRCARPPVVHYQSLIKGTRCAILVFSYLRRRLTPDWHAYFILWISKGSGGHHGFHLFKEKSSQTKLKASEQGCLSRRYDGVVPSWRVVSWRTPPSRHNRVHVGST